MKRVLLAIYLCFVISVCKAQSSLFGVPFGSTFDATKKSLQKRFGNPKSSTPQCIEYEYIEYAGFPFSQLFVDFQEDYNTTYFCGCTFIRTFESRKEMKEFAFALAAEYAVQYNGDLDYYKDSTGYSIWEGGKNPLDNTQRGFAIVSAKIGKSYAVMLTYGKYYYVKDEM